MPLLHKENKRDQHTLLDHATRMCLLILISLFCMLCGFKLRGLVESRSEVDR